MKTLFPKAKKLGHNSDHSLLFLLASKKGKGPESLTYTQPCTACTRLEGFLAFWILVHIHHLQIFTFLLPCIVIDLFLNNQPDAPIIQFYSVIKLYMFRASSLPIIMEFYTVHSALVSFMQVFDDRF
jgi:hypothetical protein